MIFSRSILALRLFFYAKIVQKIRWNTKNNIPQLLFLALGEQRLIAWPVHEKPVLVLLHRCPGHLQSKTHLVQKPHHYKFWSSKAENSTSVPQVWNQWTKTCLAIFFPLDLCKPACITRRLKTNATGGYKIRRIGSRIKFFLEMQFLRQNCWDRIQDINNFKLSLPLSWLILNDRLRLQYESVTPTAEGLYLIQKLSSKNNAFYLITLAHNIRGRS